MSSLAMPPKIRAAPACQVPKPAGLRMGARRPPILPTKEFGLSGPVPGGRLDRAQTTTTAVRMMVPARWMNSFPRSQG